MCSFTIWYVDGKYVECKNITSACYISSGSRVEVQEDKLLSHGFPVDRPIWLKSEKQSFCIGGKDIRYIEIVEES